MGQREKVSIIILIILLMFSLAGVVAGFYSFQKEKQKIITLNEQLEKLKIGKGIVENKLQISRQTINRLNTELQISSTQISKLNTELKQAKSEREDFYSQVEKLQAQLIEQEKTKKGLEAEQAQAQDQIKELKASFSGVLANKKKLEKQITELGEEEKVELGKIVVGQKETAGEGLAQLSQVRLYLEGKVLVINKDYDFAVVNLGSQNGINVGDLLSVYQEGAYIGDIRVEKNREMMSACAFTSRSVKNKIKEGDKVIRK